MGADAVRTTRWLVLLDRIQRWRGESAPARSDRYLLATLEEAFAEPGCPLCRLLAHKERRSLEALLWEQVNDPLTAERIARARGFCWEHTWALVPAGAAVHSHLGVAIVVERVLRQAFQAWSTGALARWWTPQEPCPICVWLADAEVTLLEATAALLRRDPTFLTARPGLLCRPHATALAASRAGVSLAEWEERAARELPGWSYRERLAHEVGRCPWFLPYPGVVPETCPACLAEPPRPGRLWAWLGEAFDRSAQMPARWAVACLGHALADGRSPAVDDLAALVGDLAAFVRAADYRFRGQLTEEQRASWLRALARLVGTVPAVGVHERVQTVAVLGFDRLAVDDRSVR